MTLVLDASVVIELLLHTPDAKRIDARVFDSPAILHAPHLLDIEVAQVFRRYAAKGVLTAGRGAAALRVLHVFPVVRHGHRDLLPRIWALRGNLTAYDATYVALAEVLGATLLTRDERLAKSPGHSARVEAI